MNYSNNNSQFDGNNAFSGGGFMPAPSQQTTDYNGGGSSSKNRETQGLLPLTVRQIAQAYESHDDRSNFVVDGVDVHNITLVGIVSNKVYKTTDVAFSLDDGTGVITCQKWMNEESDSKEMEAIQDGMYVRLHGNLKGFQGKKHFVVFAIRPVTNFNDIAYHFIECIYVHVYNTRLQKVQGGDVHTQPQRVNPTMGMNGAVGYQAPYPNQVSSRANPAMGMNGSGGRQAPHPSQYSASYGSDGIKGIDQRVMDFLHEPAVMGKPSGVHVNELVQQLRVPPQKIREAITSLEAEGQIYSTIDEFHYKSAVNG